MQIICPCCQSTFPIEAGINDVEARQAVKRAFDLTPMGSQLLGYVQLFKPPQRALSMAKLVKLLDQLIPTIQGGKVVYGGIVYSAPQAYWQQAMEEMIAKREQLTLPLKSHGYLISIIKGYAEKAAGKTEASVEARKVGGVTARDQPAATVKSRKMPVEIKQQLSQFMNKTTGVNDGQNKQD